MSFSISTTCTPWHLPPYLEPQLPVVNTVALKLHAHILDDDARRYREILFANAYEERVDSLVLAMHNELCKYHCPFGVNRAIRDPVSMR